MLTLYPHQKEALYKLHNGNILQGGTGSGKSLTALVYYYEKILLGHIQDSELSLPKRHINLYIITTAKKRDANEWESDMIKTHLSPDKNHYDDINKVSIYVDSWNNIKKYKDVTNSFFIFDEQKVTSFGTWSKTFISIAKRNEWILLTATPGDNWSQYLSVFIANGFYRNKREFELRHVVYNRFITKYPCIDHYVDIPRLIKCKNLITVQMDFVRSTEQIHKYVKCPYDKELYTKTLKNRWDYDKEEPIQNISGLCAKLRKISNTNEDRIKTFVDILKSHPKVIVFYSFDYELSMIKKALDSNGYIYKEWNGHKHEPVPKDDSWVYLVNYSSGAEAWNCTSTDTIVFYSQTYSYRTLVQASGRIDRLNTPYTELLYYHLLSDSPIDKAISLTLKNKRDFNEEKFIKLPSH